MTWGQKIAALKTFIRRVGPLWTGTKLSGYAAGGPYSCGHCRYLVLRNQCGHPVVQADPETKKTADGLALVDSVHGCCEFVDPGGRR